MESPWGTLPEKPPYVLGCDACYVDAFNAKADHDHRLQLDLLPEPFLGRVDAPIVLLGLNPGFTAKDVPAEHSSDYVSRWHSNLIHAPARYPFYLLDPSLDAPGRKWWEQRLGQLVKATSQRGVANSVLCVEYFPYHSRKYQAHAVLPSQTYGFELVRSALDRGALVIAMRGLPLWKAAVPELEARSHAMRSPQNPTFTRRNCPDAFDQAVEMVSAGNWSPA